MLYISVEREEDERAVRISPPDLGRGPSRDSLQISAGHVHLANNSLRFIYLLITFIALQLTASCPLIYVVSLRALLRGPVGPRSNGSRCWS